MLTSTVVEEIRAGRVVEGQGCDFKREVALHDAAAKARFVTDVVAMLNAGPGRIVIGVEEKAGRFQNFRPISGDPDAACLRFQQAILDNIDPKPTRIGVSHAEVEGGVLVMVDIPEHQLRPYQNTITGAFHIRTGTRNTPLGRDEVRAQFMSKDRCEGDLGMRLRAEDLSIDEQGLMEAGASLHIGVLPREHYSGILAPFRRVEGMRVKVAPTFFDGRGSTFEGCNGGFQAVQRTWDLKAVYRMFVGHDWFMHVRVASPFRIDEGGGGLRSLQPSMTELMSGLADFSRSEGLLGPFCVSTAVRGLRVGQRTAWLFPNTDEVALPRARMLESLDDPSLVGDFCGMVFASSIHG